jgi:hypothetical protein
MVTDCFGVRAGNFSATEEVFLQGSLSLLKVIVPCAICFVIRKLHTANKNSARQNISILGLNEPSTEVKDADLHLSRISPFIWFLYVTTMIVTFNLGLLSVLACEFLRHTLHKLLP